MSDKQGGGVERTVPPCPDCGSEEVSRKEGFITCYSCEFYANSAGPSKGPFSHHRTGEKLRFVSTDGGVERGKEWFAGVMWEEMPEDAKEQLRDGDRDE